jgi:hypothetical protein
MNGGVTSACAVGVSSGVGGSFGIGHDDRDSDWLGTAQAASVGAHAAFDSFAEVVEQVPAVCDVDRVRSSGPRSLSEGARAVAAYRRDTGVATQPVGDGGRLPIRKQVDRTPGDCIDDDTGIDASLAQGEFVQAQHRRHCRDLRVRDRTDQPQQGGASGRQSKPNGQPRPGTAGQCQADLRQRRLRSRGESRVWAGQILEALRERHRIAGGVPAAKPAHRQAQLDPPSRQCQIHQAPPVVAVDGLRPGTARRATRTRFGMTEEESHQVSAGIDPLHHQPAELRQQGL